MIINYNICDNQDESILTDNGFITSPNYPVYSQVATQCTRKIQAPASKIIRLRVLDIGIKTPDSSNK